MNYFLTIAYNAEHTLPRTIESVLSQTCGDFQYHLCDHASLDATGDIIRYYAKADRRIQPIFATKNDPLAMLRNDGQSAEIEKNVCRLMFQIEPDDWFSWLDADDDYEPGFLEEMLRFADREKLDFAACRSNHVIEPEGLPDNRYILNRDIVIEGSNFGLLFPQYFRFMGAYWGKIQKGALFRRINQASFDKWLSATNLHHRADTAMELYFLRHSQRAGVLAKTLHNYHLYPSGLSAENGESKRNDNLKMPEIYREFLRDKVGYVSPENEAYIQEVFERSQKRTMEQRESGS